MSTTNDNEIFSTGVSEDVNEEISEGVLNQEQDPLIKDCCPECLEGGECIVCPTFSSTYEQFLYEEATKSN